MSILTTLSYSTDLDQGIRLQRIRPALLSLDQEAHHFRIACTHGNQAADLSGASVTGYFLRADGVTVPITGSVEDNCAALTLPAACYTRCGRFSLVVKLGLGSTISTIFWGEGAVAASRSDAILDQEDLLPDLTELLAQIDAMEAVSQRAEQAAVAAEGAADAARSNQGSGLVAMPTYWSDLTPLAESDRLTVLEAARPILTDDVQAVFDAIPDGGSATLTVEGASYTLRRLGEITDTLMFHSGALNICRKIAEDDATLLLTEYTFEPVACTDMTALFDHFELPCTVDNLLSGKVSQVSYAACGAYLDGVHDDYEAMYRAHYIGDLCSCDVIQHGGVIYKACSGWLYIRNHNVDLTGSSMKLDAYNRYGSYWLSATSVWALEDDVHAALLPQMTEYSHTWSAVETGFPSNGLFIVTHPAAAQRWNSGELTAEERVEVVRHASDGRVYSTVIDAADENTLVTFHKYPDTQITFRGCTLDIDISMSSVAMYFLRCERSNVIIRDFLVNPTRRTTMNTGYRGAVFTLNKCADVVMENIKGINIAGRPRDEYPRGVAGYILNATSILDLTVRDCNLLGYWGCVGLNGAKEITFDGCELNRVDIHDYFRNLTINNCRIYGQTINIGYGKGAVNLTNCSVMTDWVHQIVNLRCDYGRYFEGEINICNVDAVYTGETYFDIVSGVTLYSEESAANTGLFMSRYPTIHVSNVTMRVLGDSYAGYVFNMPEALEETIEIADKRKVIEFTNITVYDENGDLQSIAACPLEGVTQCSAQELASLHSELNDLSARLAAVESSAAPDYLYYSRRTLAYAAANANIRLTLPYEDTAAIYQVTCTQLEGDDVTLTVTDWTTSTIMNAGDTAYIRLPAGEKTSGKVVIFAVYPGSNSGSYQITVERTAATDAYTGDIQVDFAAA